MTSHLLDDWDERLLDQVIQSADHATSSLNPNTTFLTPTPIAAAPITSSSSFPSEKNCIVSSTYSAPFRAGKEQSFWSRGNVSSSCHSGRNGSYMVQTEAFSPPRELSQKPLMFGGSVVDETEVTDRRNFRSGIVIGKEEVERLKRELARVSKQLANKDGQLKRAFTELEAKDLEISILKTEKLETLNPNGSHIPLQPDGMDISSDWACHDYPTSEGKVARGNEQAVKCTDGISNYKSKREIGASKDQVLDDFRFKSTAELGKEALNVTVGTTELNCRGTIDNCTTTSNGYVNQEHSFPVNSVQPTLTKAIGVQAELDVDPCSTFRKDEMSFQHDVSSDLFAIWGSSVNKNSGRDLVSKLLVTCSEEFYMLFRFMGLTSEVNLNNLSDESSSDMDIRIHSAQSVHSAQVSRLYAVLVKVSKGMVEMGDFLEVLVDLCIVDNVLVAQKSLYILRTMLVMVFSSETRPYKWVSQSNGDFVEEKEIRVHIDNIMDLTKYNSDSKSEDRYTCFQELCEKEKIHYTTYIFMERQISLIEAMQKVAIKNTSEDILIEAFSIINLIVMGSDPILEREKFGVILLNESFPKFLMKEAGVNVQRKALQVLFLLMNCPKLMTMFCDQSKDVNLAEISENQVSNVILKGLSECITCEGKSISELKLQRKAIIVLAFIASSCQSGFEILLKPVTQQGVNFLELVGQILSLEIGAEGASITKSQEFFNERIVVMREALILLNRLASNASYSKSVLVILTRNTTFIRLAIDVASKISRRSRGCRNYDSSNKLPILESETIDLANSFRARVLSFLGESVS